MSFRNLRASGKSVLKLSAKRIFFSAESRSCSSKTPEALQEQTCGETSLVQSSLELMQMLAAPMSCSLCRVSLWAARQWSRIEIDRNSVSFLNSKSETRLPIHLTSRVLIFELMEPLFRNPGLSRLQFWVRQVSTSFWWRLRMNLSVARIA